MKSVIAILLLLSLSHSAFAGPRVDIVIGEKAPELERLAADELSGQLKRIYEADVTIASTAPADAPHVIFVGSPDTNASMKPFANSWPNGDKKLTDQGHLLRSVTHRDRSALMIGGGSPVATYWAVSEFGHRLGIRSLLFGDLDPVSPPSFGLDGIDVVREPTQRERGWHFLNHRPTDSGSWGLDEFRRVAKQLAKLKFNRMTVQVDVGAPFVHFEYSGVKRQSGVLWEEDQFRVSGDTAGRKVFGGEKMFENPAFVGATTYEQRIAAGTKLLNGVIDAAHEVGMTIHFQFPVTEFPPDFSKFTPGYSGPQIFPPRSGVEWADFAGNDKASNLAKAQTRAYLDTYSNLDGVELRDRTGESPLNPLRQLFSDPSFWKRPNVRGWDVRSSFNRGESERPVSAPFLDHNQKADSVAGAAVIFLSYRTDYVLPRWHGDLPEQLKQAKQIAPNGFQVTSAGISDLDVSAYWLSRVSFGDSVTLGEACVEMLEPVCGEGVADRVLMAMRQISHAQFLMDDWLWLGETLSHSTINRLESVNDSKVISWGSAKDHYLNAMNEMYRANTRAREGGRAYTLYWARRCEFAFEYMNCIESVRKAGVAELKNDTATQIAELEKAIESLNNALNAMAAVARSNSDRGLIAVLNQRGYRPLKKKLAEAEAAAK